MAQWVKNTACHCYGTSSIPGWEILHAVGVANHPPTPLLLRAVVKIQDIFNTTHWEPTTCQELCQVIYIHQLYPYSNLGTQSYSINGNYDHLTK